MSQTKIQGPFLTDGTVGGSKLADTLTVSANTNFTGTSTTINNTPIATTGKAIAMAVVFGG